MEVVNLTQKLISYNTVSHYSNLEVMDLIQHLMEEMGCNVERIEYTDKNGVIKQILSPKKATLILTSERALR